LYSLSAKSKYADKFPLLFTEIRAKELVKKGWTMDTHDWYTFTKEKYLENWMKSGVPTETRFDRLSYARERNWESFVNSVSGNGIGKKDLIFILLVSIGGGALVYYQTQDLGTISMIIAPLSGLIVLLLSILIYSEK
jgi:hypothetical protein